MRSIFASIAFIAFIGAFLEKAFWFITGAPTVAYIAITVLFLLGISAYLFTGYQQRKQNGTRPST